MSINDTSAAAPVASTPPLTVGAMPIGAAGVAEFVRGLGTTGLLLWILYGALQEAINNVGKDVQEVGNDVKALAVRLDSLASQVQTLRQDVTVLQVDVATLKSQAQPKR